MLQKLSVLFFYHWYILWDLQIWAYSIFGLCAYLTPSPPCGTTVPQDVTWHDWELFVRPPANRDQFMIQLDRPEPLGARRRSPTLHRASKEAQNGPLVARVCV